MIRIGPAGYQSLEHVLQNLRQADRAELAACEANLERMPEEILQRKVFAFSAYTIKHGWVAAWGMLQSRSGVGAGFAFGTPHWGLALLPIVRHIRGFVLPYLRSEGFHRVEALAMAHRQDVARFMSMIGAKPEATLRGYGAHGEDFISYRWLADEHGSERRSARAVCTYTTH